MNRAGLNGRCLAIGLLAASLGACATYAPAPPHAEQFAARLAARRLDEKPAGAVWSGADLLNAALRRNASLAEARAKYQLSLAAARTARQALGPTLTLTAEYASERSHWGYGAGAELPLDRGVRRSSRFTTADLQALQTFYNYGEAVWTVRTVLTKARIDLTMARAEVTLAARAVDLRRQRFERLDRRVAIGEDPRSVSLLAQREQVAAERRMSEAKGRHEQAVVSLAVALGVDPDAVRTVTLEPVATSPMAPLPELATWRRDASASRGDVLRAIADYDLSESALRLEVVRQYPEVRLSPGYFYDHGVNKLPFNLALVLPGYDLNRHAIAQAELARAAAGRALEAVQAAALSAVDADAAALATAQADLDRTLTRDLPAARRAAVDTLRSTIAGKTDRTDDLAAQAAEVEAELTLLDAQRAVRIAAADLEDALRRSFDPAETAVLQAVMTRPGEPR